MSHNENQFTNAQQLSHFEEYVERKCKVMFTQPSCSQQLFPLSSLFCSGFFLVIGSGTSPPSAAGPRPRPVPGIIPRGGAGPPAVAGRGPVAPPVTWSGARTVATAAWTGPGSTAAAASAAPVVVAIGTVVAGVLDAQFAAVVLTSVQAVIGVLRIVPGKKNNFWEGILWFLFQTVGCFNCTLNFKK